MFSGEKEKIEIDVTEVYRYLGYKGNDPSPSIIEKIDACIEDIRTGSDPRGFYRRFPIKTGPKETRMIIGTMEVYSRDLCRNLQDCVEVYIFGATIGIATDRLIARASVNDMMAATVYQAVGAAYIEAYCDMINDEITGIVASEGRGTKRRFSPGYGDFGVEYQRQIFDMLELSKHTGISLTDSMLMTPSKSVTAIVGVTCEVADSDDGKGHKDHDCSTCTMMDCSFRKV